MQSLIGKPGCSSKNIRLTGMCTLKANFIWLRLGKGVLPGTGLDATDVAFWQKFCLYFAQCRGPPALLSLKKEAITSTIANHSPISMY